MQTSTRILFAVLGFIGFAIITYLAVVIGTSVVWDLTGVHDQDGGGAMALGLVIGPMVALLGGIIGMIALPVWMGKRMANRPPPSPEAAIADRGRMIIAGVALVGGYLGVKIVDLAFWLASPIEFDSYWKAWAVSWLPWLGFVAAALASGLIARRVIRNEGG